MNAFSDTTRALLKDPYVLAAVLLVALVSIPLGTPSLDSVFWTSEYPFYFDAPLLALTALALWTARAQSDNNQARQFWTYLAAAFLCWLAVRSSAILVPQGAAAATLISDLLYLAFYLFLILGFQLRPYRNGLEGGDLIRQLETTGATLFGFGLLVYFIIIPAAYNPTSLATNIPSAMLYVAFNLYLFAVVLWRRRSWRHEPWRSAYTWLVVGIAGFVLLDGVDLASRIDKRVDAALLGTVFESLWLLPLLGFVAAARSYVLRVADSRSTAPAEDSEHQVLKWRGILSYFALAPLLIHVAFEICGWSDEATRTPRQALVMFWALSTAGLGLLYDRRLLRQQHGLEERHQLASQQLERVQRMDTVRRMAGGIAHDFNNLLMVIQGFADMLSIRLQKEKDRSDAEQISAAARRASELTNQLLALGTRERRGIQPFRPNDLLSKMEPTLRQLVTADVAFETSFADAGYVLGDSGAFEDAVLNLVLNAREASHVGGTIRISAGTVVVEGGGLLADILPPGRYGFVSVDDDGKGMDEETLGHIFEPFFSKRSGGTGLGLSMVYTFAQEAGGTVDVRSRPAEGSQFRILLPAGYPPADLEEVGRTQQPATLSARTVLLVEDEESVRVVLKRSLEEAGMRVLEAGNGSDAFSIVKADQGDIDVIVTDVVMPIMDGGTFARKVREIERFMPIIFMTGYAAGQLDRLDDLTASAPVLRKPFAPEALLREIERCLRNEDGQTS